MIYNEEHSVTFMINGEEKNTWSDWLLVPVSRPAIVPPPVQSFTEEIPGRSGKFDYMNSILIDPAYDNREGTLEFIIDHDNDKYFDWHVTYNQVMKFLHGQFGRMILADEPDYYYEGRFHVEEFNSNADWSTIVIGYDVQPIKLSTVSSLDAWKWDPFNFCTGIIRNYEDFVFELRTGTGVQVTINDVPQTSRVTLEFENIQSDSPVRISLISYSNNMPAFRTQKVVNLISSDDKITFEIYKDFPTFSITPEFNTNIYGSAIKLYVRFEEGSL